MDRKQILKRMGKRVLGLDASTTTIGIAVIDFQFDVINNIPQVKLVHNSFFKPPKNGNIFVRLNKVRSFITDLINQWQPDEVVIEDIILFMQSKSSAQTVSGLAVLNRTVGLSAFDALGHPPTLLSVMTIRHRLKTSKALPAKEEMPDVVAHHLGIKFPYILNRNKKVAKENYDMADAMAVALAFINILAEKGD